MNAVLYKIHSVDIEEAGLSDYGKKGIGLQIKDIRTPPAKKKKKRANEAFDQTLLSI